MVNMSGALTIILGNPFLDTNRKEFQVDLIVRAPDYNNPVNRSNDIALLRLTEEADLTVYTPVCLPAHNQIFTGRQSIVTGWGATSDMDPSSDTLQELKGLQVLSDSECRSAMESVQGFSGSDISSDMLCAGGEQGRDACQGDSGGPLIVQEEESFTLIGVVSWGIGCARNNLPGIYAEVSSKTLHVYLG